MAYKDKENAREYDRKRYLNVKNKHQFCKQCDAEYLTRYIHQKYCSIQCSGIANTKKVNKKCLICLKSFMVPLSGIKRGQGKYCSNKCFGESINKQIILICFYCKKSFKDSESRVKRRKHSFCNRKCFSKYYSGVINHAWRGGVTPIIKKYRATYEYKQWRKSVFERDNWTCIKCGQHGGNLEADHVIPFIVSLINKKYNEIIDTANGQTLCVACHRKTDTWGKSYKQLIKSGKWPILDYLK